MHTLLCIMLDSLLNLCQADWQLLMPTVVVHQVSQRIR